MLIDFDENIHTSRMTMSIRLVEIRNGCALVEVCAF